VAVNLACTLAKQGLQVGLLDADIYGPSLPSLLNASDVTVRRSKTNDKNVLPLTAQALPNLKFLSFGHVNPQAGAPGAGGKSAAMMRGPMATKVLTQLMLCTEWGELDYLVSDLQR
jgi:ATP-binding protein involved in chromosome partitioning